MKKRLRKKLFTGKFVVIKNNYNCFNIGEIVEINGFKGEVISLTLKTTRLKSYKGEVKVIANRNIGEITNYSLDNVLVRVIASVSYEADNKKVEKVLNELIEKLNTSIPELKSKITIEGIDSLSASSVDYLLTAKSSVKNEFVVKRKLLKELLVPTVTNFKGSYILILIMIIIVTFAITAICDFVRNKKKIKDNN